MKKIILLFLLISILGCSSNNNCDSERESINKEYDRQVQYVKDHPGPKLNQPDVLEIDYKQISLLNEERNKKLNQACD